MFSDNQKISLRQLQALLFLYFWGTPALLLPAELAGESGRGCWVVMLLGGLAATVFSLVITILWKWEPSWTGVEWLRRLCGSALGSVLAIGFAGKIALDAIVEARVFAEVLRSTVLPHTPLWLVVGVLLLLCVFAVLGGMEGQARTAEILFFFVFVPLVLVLLTAALSAEHAYYLPLEMPTAGQIYKGAAVIQPLFQGMIFLFFLSPFLQRPKQAGKSVFGVCLCITLLMTVTVFLCLTVYGVDTLTRKLFPTLQLMERVGFSGIYLGRQDVLLLWFWMASVFLYLSGALFFGSVCCGRIFRQKETIWRKWLWVWLPLILVGTLLPRDIASAYAFRNGIQPYVSAVYVGILPLICIGVHIASERRRRRA